MYCVKIYVETTYILVVHTIFRVSVNKMSFPVNNISHGLSAGTHDIDTISNGKVNSTGYMTDITALVSSSCQNLLKCLFPEEMPLIQPEESYMVAESTLQGESLTKSWVNNAIIQDRIFWIYFMVTLFFIIVGVGSIIASPDPNMLIISLIWLVSNVALMIIVYHESLTWGPTDDQDSLICVVDSNSPCFEPNNRVWLLINVLFIALLIISLLWAGELSNPDAGPLKTMSGVLIILGGLVLCRISTVRSVSYIIPFWVSLGYLAIWFGLTLYVAL